MIGEFSSLEDLDLHEYDPVTWERKHGIERPGSEVYITSHDSFLFPKFSEYQIAEIKVELTSEPPENVADFYEFLGRRSDSRLEDMCEHILRALDCQPQPETVSNRE